MKKITKKAMQRKAIFEKNVFPTYSINAILSD